MMIPVADISEQISTAGMEGSGTGNMKFMMNGAVTLGTLDGANVEISQRVGRDNIFIFGATVEEIARMERYGSYRPSEFYEQNADIRNAMNCLIDGTLPMEDSHQFSDLYHSLLFGDSEKADRYYLLHDFASYNQTYIEAMEAYENKEMWARMAASNTAESYFFCVDRTIQEYNDLVWHMTALK
jgi:starch phosphorylase